MHTVHPGIELNWMWSMKCIFKLITHCWFYTFSSWKEPWQSSTVAFLLEGWGISGPEKQRNLCEVRHTLLGRLAWNHHPCFASRGNFLAPSWIQAGKAHLVYLSLHSSPSPPTLSPWVERGSSQLPESGGEGVGQVWSQGESTLEPWSWDLCSPPDPGDMIQHQPRNNNGPWFYSYEMLFLSNVFDSLISWLDFSVPTLSLSPSGIPLTVARTFCHASGHNFYHTKTFGGSHCLWLKA